MPRDDRRPMHGRASRYRRRKISKTGDSRVAPRSNVRTCANPPHRGDSEARVKGWRVEEGGCLAMVSVIAGWRASDSTAVARQAPLTRSAKSSLPACQWCGLHRLPTKMS